MSCDIHIKHDQFCDSCRDSVRRDSNRDVLRRVAEEAWMYGRGFTQFELVGIDDPEEMKCLVCKMIVDKMIGDLK